MNKSRASKIYSSKSNSSVSRGIIERIIGNRDGKMSEIMRKNNSDNEGGEEVEEKIGSLKHDEGTFPSARVPMPFTDSDTVPVTPTYILVP